MGAGAYELSAQPGKIYFLLTGVQSHDKVMLTALRPHDAPAAWKRGGNPILEFACGEEGCALRRIWTGGDSAVREVPRPKSESEMPAGLAMIRLIQVK
jgi:hypothetical protein